jgi:hypothetical protein
VGHGATVSKPWILAWKPGAAWLFAMLHPSVCGVHCLFSLSTGVKSPYHSSTRLCPNRQVPPPKRSPYVPLNAYLLCPASVRRSAIQHAEIPYLHPTSKINTSRERTAERARCCRRTLIGITNNGGFEGADPEEIFIIEPRLSAPKLCS